MCQKFSQLPWTFDIVLAGYPDIPSAFVIYCMLSILCYEAFNREGRLENKILMSFVLIFECVHAGIDNFRTTLWEVQGELGYHVITEEFFPQ